MNKITNPTQKITNDHGENHTYVFEENAKNAINAALLINRPLLIRGEPGVGKSQLAKAAAEALGRAYIPFVINASTESQDLLWTFDAVARLADAQIEGALCKTDKEKEEARDRLALHRYLKPAALWIALNWKSAKEQYEDTHNPELSPLSGYQGDKNVEENGVVLLIDEIDKADSSVPNGLLEVLGSNRFHPEGLDKPIEVDGGVKPLIIITTNEERTLPDAFIRRCLSVTLGLPKQKAKQIEYLVNHAKPNFTKLDRALNNDKDQTLLEAAAEMILEDRAQASQANLHPLPGQAEYFDLLRGIEKMLDDDQNNIEDVLSIMTQLSQFTSKKHPDFKQKDD